MNLALICVGAGRGERFGGDKLAQRLAGQPVLLLALHALHEALPEAPLIVVLPADRLERWRREVARVYPRATLVPGGERRQDSVRRGVEAAAELGTEVVAVHDAARALVHPDDVRRVVKALGDGAGAILGQRVADTVKRVDSEGSIRATVPRQDLRLALTPQVFRIEALQMAWNSVDPGLEWTDEAALVEVAGLPVSLVEARHPNPKLTTREDLVLMEALVELGEAAGEVRR
jgi:2-C-methyl-D-erythritol 4-phosphate cytidylyltransferase